MKAIILAAGEGVRMRPLTLKIPKPLLKIHGRPILDYVFDAFPEEITEVIVVVRYLGEQIRNYLGSEYRGRKIIYAEGSSKGTAYSFLAAKNLVVDGERFLVVHGDEFPSRDDVEKCLEAPLSTIIFEYDQPEKAGVVTVGDDGYIKKIIEKPENPESNIVVGGIMLLDKGIFSYEPLPNTKGEFYLSSMLSQFARDFSVKGVFTERYIGDITTPADIKRVESIFSGKKKTA